MKPKHPPYLSVVAEASSSSVISASSRCNCIGIFRGSGFASSADVTANSRSLHNTKTKRERVQRVQRVQSVQREQREKRLRVGEYRTREKRCEGGQVMTDTGGQRVKEFMQRWGQTQLDVVGTVLMRDKRERERRRIYTPEYIYI